MHRSGLIELKRLFGACNVGIEDDKYVVAFRVTTPPRRKDYNKVFLRFANQVMQSFAPVKVATKAIHTAGKRVDGTLSFPIDAVEAPENVDKIAMLERKQARILRQYAISDHNGIAVSFVERIDAAIEALDSIGPVDWEFGRTTFFDSGKKFAGIATKTPIQNPATAIYALSTVLGRRADELYTLDDRVIIPCSFVTERKMARIRRLSSGIEDVGVWQIRDAFTPARPLLELKPDEPPSP
jgi:hypothetical protein